MDSKPTAPKIPEDLNYAIEEVIRSANKHGYVIIGTVFKHEPLSIAIMRNTKDDPAKLFQAVTDMLTVRLAKDAVVEQIVGRVN